MTMILFRMIFLVFMYGVLIKNILLVIVLRCARDTYEQKKNLQIMIVSEEKILKLPKHNYVAFIIDDDFMIDFFAILLKI